MSVICVVAAEWGRDGVEARGRAVLKGGVVPRVAVEAGRLWADGRGIQIESAVTELRRVLQQAGVRAVRCGVARTPVAAWAAAAADTEELDTCIVHVGTDRAFLAPLRLELLEPDDRLRSLLEGVGIVTCGQLAEIPREAVEVRFGGDAVAIWRLARAEDRRRLFHPLPPERPHASMDFVDYVVTSPEQLLFITNALISNLCARLTERGEHARALRLDLPLANGERWSRALRPARPTASRSVWLRLARTVLERLTVPDAVAGVGLHVQATEAASSIQGDLFDTGFATSGAVDAALLRLLENQGSVLVRPAPCLHPLPERGVELLAIEPGAHPERWRCADSEDSRDGAGESVVMTPGRNDLPFEVVAPAGLTLQLLPQARPVLVETIGRRDHFLPIRFRDGRWIQLVTAAGPDRISGGACEAPYAREYFRGVTAEGTLVLLFRDACADSWYLHGWWD